MKVAYVFATNMASTLFSTFEIARLVRTGCLIGPFDSRHQGGYFHLH